MNRVEDIASFRVVVANSNKVLVNDTVDYNVREYVANNVNDGQYVICVDTVDSNGQRRPHFYSQCIQLDTDHINVDNFVPEISFNDKQVLAVESTLSSANRPDIQTILILLNVLLLFK